MHKNEKVVSKSVINSVKTSCRQGVCRFTDRPVDTAGPQSTGNHGPCVDSFCRVMAGGRVEGRPLASNWVEHPAVDRQTPCPPETGLAQWPRVQQPAWRGRAGVLGCTQEPVESASLWALSPRPLRGGAPVGTEPEGGVVAREWALGFTVGVLPSMAVIDETWECGRLADSGSRQERPGSVAGARAWARLFSGQEVTGRHCWREQRGQESRGGAGLGVSGPDHLIRCRQTFTRTIWQL